MDFGLEQSNISYDAGSSMVFNFLTSVITILVVALVIYIILVLIRKFFARHIAPKEFQHKVYRLTVPQRNDQEKEEKKNIKEMIASLENLYANLGGMKAQKGFRAWLLGRSDVWSFEIVVDADKLITFYMAVPDYLEEHIKQQFLSQHPYCQIEEVGDYNIFGPNGFVAAGYMTLVKSKMFPILTYKQMETDPLIAVLSTLAKLPEGQTVAIQYVMRSARKQWRQPGIKVAHEMHQGKSLDQALRSTKGGGWVGALGKTAEVIKSAKPENQASSQPEQYKLSAMEEQMTKGIEEKASKAGMDVNIRVVAFGQNEEQAKNILRQVFNAYAQYSSYQYANGFKATIKSANVGLINDFIYRTFNEKINCVLNTEEMVSLWHLPFPETAVPNIRWLGARTLPPPVNMPTDGLILGENIYRGHQTLVRIKDNDRRRHMYIIGMTGAGKSWFQANLAIQDIRAGHGVAVIDPHGALVEDILPYIPPSRLKDVIYFDPSDTDRPIGLNMLEATTQQEMDFAASEMITIFYKLLPDPAMAGPMFEHYMRNALLALMADTKNPGSLVELARIFTDEAFRKEKLSHVTDILVKDFWEREYPASQKGSTGADMLSYVISKTGRFVENEMMRNIIGQSKSGINFREIMDQQKILLINLSKGKTGEMNSNLLGLIIVAKLQMAAMARADIPEKQRKDFYLYIDEFQNFITDSIAIILAEARKYRLNLIMGHQYINQLIQNNDSSIRDAVFGNVGNIVAFRIGVDDSEVIAKQLAPVVSEYDVLNIEKFNAYVRLLIDNTAADTFNMHAFPLPDDRNEDIATRVKEMSRHQYGRDKATVMKEIIERSKIGQFKKRPVGEFSKDLR